MAGDGGAVLRKRLLDLIGGGAIEAGDVDVSDPGVAAFGFAFWPAHDFDAGEPLGGGEGYDLLEAQILQDGGDESELQHSWISLSEVRCSDFREGFR